jgi:hypothetical protein
MEIIVFIVFIVKKLLVFGLLCLCGYWIITNRVKLVEWTGYMGWAENYLGQGATFTVWGAVGIGFIFFAFLELFGLREPFIIWTVSWIPGIQKN